MNILDRVIGYFSPSWGASRAESRATMNQVNAITGNDSASGFAAGKSDRFSRGRTPAMVKTHAVEEDQTHNMIAWSWKLYRDNSYARKIVNSIQSKVVGQGMAPESQAIFADGTPNEAFRRRAKELWNDIQSGFDYRGAPSKGGLTFAGMQRLALKMTILSGNAFYRLVPIDDPEQRASRLPVPMKLQLIDASRLASENNLPPGAIASGNQFYRGIELDERGLRVQYWFNAIRAGSTSPDLSTAIKRPLAEIGHLFLEEDLDQYLGTPWFAPAILGVRDIADLQYNVLKQSAMAACVVGSYSKPTGASRFGLNASAQTQPNTADGTDLTDEDGNAITKLQPAMMVNTGKDGSFQLHSPNQPNMNPEGFITHMLRGVSAGVPGVKSSTVTGDYRNSSFSSEKAADNDTWPEIEALQEWFASGFCQPIWEAVVIAAAGDGYFGELASADEVKLNASLYTGAKWQGPVGRSINPIQDAEAAGRRVQLGISSLQMECAKVGVNWRDTLTDASELYATAESLELPPEVVNNILGIGANDVIAQTNKAGSDSTDDGKTPVEDSEEVFNV